MSQFSVSGRALETSQPFSGSWVAGSTSLAVCRHLPNSRCSHRGGKARALSHLVLPCATPPSPSLGAVPGLGSAALSQGPSEGAQDPQGFSWAFPGIDHTRMWKCLVQTTLTSQVLSPLISAAGSKALQSGLMALIKYRRIGDRAPNLSGDQRGFYLFAFSLTRAPGCFDLQPRGTKEIKDPSISAGCYRSETNKEHFPPRLQLFP